MDEETKVKVPEIVEHDWIKFVIGEEKVVFTNNWLFSVCFVKRNRFMYKPYKSKSLYRSREKKWYKYVVWVHVKEMPWRSWIVYVVPEDWIPVEANGKELTRIDRDYFRDVYREIAQRRAEDWLTAKQESELQDLKNKDLMQIEEALS